MRKLIIEKLMSILLINRSMRRRDQCKGHMNTKDVSMQRTYQCKELETNKLKHYIRVNYFLVFERILISIVFYEKLLRLIAMILNQMFVCNFAIGWKKISRLWVRNMRKEWETVVLVFIHWLLFSEHFS